MRFSSLAPMIQHRWAVALPLLSLLFLPLTACTEVAEAPGPDDPERGEELLADLPFADVIRGSLGLEELSGTVALLRSPQGAVFRYLGRLVGRLTAAEGAAMALFYDYVPPEDPALIPRSLEPGVYMALVSAGPNGQVVYSGPLVLAAGGEGLIPWDDARQEGIAPFRQNSPQMGATVSIRPALLIDLEGDGVEELVLARRFARETIAWEEYEVYRRSPQGGGWTRVVEDAPALALLDYWGRLAAAAAIASRWDPETRLAVVWDWLGQERAILSPELLLELVPDGDPERVRHEQEALTYLRTFFEGAHARFSPDFQVRQPWPAFINSFKKTEGVRLLAISSPTFQPEGEAVVSVLLDLTEREGPDKVVRRFLVTTRLVQKEGEWLLDGVEDTQQQEP